jgi:ATP synthase protein I
VHGAASAVLGGGVNIVAALVFAVLARMIGPRGRMPPRGLHVAMATLFRAEGGKVLAIIAQLWLVLSIYREVVPVAFFSAFVITVIVFSMAFFVHE